jgi:hypothetical protein
MWKNLYDRLYSWNLPFGRNFQHFKERGCITEEWRMGEDRLSEMIFAIPEKKVLSQAK